MANEALECERETDTDAALIEFRSHLRTLSIDQPSNNTPVINDSHVDVVNTETATSSDQSLTLSLFDGPLHTGSVRALHNNQVDLSILLKRFSNYFLLTALVVVFVASVLWHQFYLFIYCSIFSRSPFIGCPV